MESNTHSSLGSAERPDRLARLTAAVEALDGQDLDGRDLQGLTDAALAEQTLQLRRLLHRLEGHWLQHLAAVDACGAAGADQGIQVGSTRPGCGAGSGWAPAPPPAWSAPPEPCSADP
jgi:hypothetical protein